MTDAVITEENIDVYMSACKQKALALITECERKFIDSVVERGAMTRAKALKIVGDQRATVLDELDVWLRDIRAALLRGGRVHH